MFVTKYRQKIFSSENIEDLKNVFETVAKSMDFKVLEINGEADHIHLMIEYPPKLSISKIVNHLKGLSSRLIKPKLDKLPYSTHLWSPSYFASSCGGITLERLKDYINNQQ
ncbi:MAG: IS200/IS605 family transposase [Microcoleaceae cyanobacterium]